MHGTRVRTVDLIWFALNTTNGQLSAIGLILGAICVVAWLRSNRSEATPNVDQIHQIRQFVVGHFAAYVARGLAAEGAQPSAVGVADDRAWQKVFIQHLRLNNELYAFREDVALEIFRESIDAAVAGRMARVTTTGSGEV